MTAGQLLLDLQDQGFTLTVRGDTLVVSPGSRLTPELCNAIREHKPALLVLVRMVPVPDPLDIQGWDDPCLVDGRDFQRSLFALEEMERDNAVLHRLWVKKPKPKPKRRRKRGRMFFNSEELRWH